MTSETSAITPPCTDWYVARNNLYCPYNGWCGRGGVWRRADRDFILASYVHKDSEAGPWHRVPLNTVNLKDIFAILPDVDMASPSPVHAEKGKLPRRVAVQIHQRALRLLCTQGAVAQADRAKLEKGVVKDFIFWPDHGPFREETVGADWDIYNPPGRKLYYQQRAALDLLSTQPRLLLAMQQRVGKTPVMVVNARSRRTMGEIDCCVVVSTRRLLHTAWTDDLVHYDPQATQLIVDSDAQREELFQNKYDYVLTSFESLYRNWSIIRRLHDPSRIMLVADETIKIKNPNAKRTTALYAAAAECGFVYLLSGAPVSRLHSDIIPQMMCVDPGLFGENYEVAMDYFWEFRGQDMEFRKERKHLFHEIADCGMWRCTRGESEQFSGRESVSITEELAFHPLQAQLYRDLARDMYAAFATNEEMAAVAAANRLVLLLRLREICGGFMSYEWAPGCYLRVRLPSNPKIDWLRRKFEESPDIRPIIYMEFNEEEEQVGDLLDELEISWGGILRVAREREGRYSKYGTPDRYGSENEQLNKHIADFQSGKRQVFVGKHSSIGHGVTLSAADTEIYYNIGFNSDNYDQAHCRAFGASKEVVLVYHLLMGGSVEQEVYKALRKRQNMKTVLLKDSSREGYYSFFEEIAFKDLLIDPSFRGRALEDALEIEARRILGYSGPLTREALAAHATLSGVGLFGKIKDDLGGCTGLKHAFRVIAGMFHPDMAIAAGHAKDSPTYSLYEVIFKRALEARDKQYSLGDFIAAIGGKAPEKDWQMWYDYLLRRARSEEVTEPIQGQRRIA